MIKIKIKNKIERAIKLLKNGELIVYPTDTLYGLGADIFNEKAVKKVYDIKKRPYNLPLSISISDVNDIEEFAFMNDLAYKIVNKFMPGAITIVLKKKRIIPDIVAKNKIWE